MSGQVLDTNAAIKHGYLHMEQGRFAHAERAARGVLAVSPDNATALTLLGIALTAQERHAESARIFRELSRRQPKVASHWTNLGTVLRSERRTDEALQAYQRAAALGEASADFKLNFGLLHTERGDHESARVALREAHELTPLDAEIAYHYANSCYQLMRLVEGAAALANWRSFQIHSTEGVAKIAVLLMKLRDVKAGRAALDRALADPAPDAATRVQLVLALERLNRLDEARTHLDVLLTQPRPAMFDEEVHTANAKLTDREGRHEDAARLYGQLADSCADAEQKHYFLYPMAKSLDAAGQYDAAFATLQRAHESHSSYLDRSAADAGWRREPPMWITARGSNAEDYSRWDTSGSPARETSPVFIVAFPRSGTTLLEHALAAHPQLVTMDEQPFIQMTLQYLSAGEAVYPERMADLTPAQLATAREHYWSLVANRVSIGAGQRLLDKNPLNIMQLPAIRRLFPNAPILLAIRHPCDVILSCYMQHFRAEFTRACRDLPTLADAHTRMFAYWYQQVALLQPTAHEIFYERFVRDFEAGMREVATFLELPWHDAMLEPATHAKSYGYISTPSYSQVVQPVHTRSIGRWKAYERHLEPVLPVLQPQLERWGYEV
jgi:tetratricopeptide (TPR) repeat protein